MHTKAGFRLFDSNIVEKLFSVFVETEIYIFTGLFDVLYREFKNIFL